MPSPDEEEDITPPDRPPPATLQALLDQNTQETRTEARRFAESRLQYIRGAGRPIPKHYDEEIVNDAIADTWLGIAKWDPARCSLLVHLRGEILDRTSKEARHARRFRRISLDLAANDPIDAARIEPAILPPLNGDNAPILASSGDCAPILFASMILEVTGELLALARGDLIAEAMLRCWRDFVIERDEVIARTHMTERQYKATRKRLLSLAKKLPPRLRATARELLRSAS